MDNRFTTSQEVTDDMMQSARREVDKMPLKSCEKLVAGPCRGAFGISGAIGVTFILACMERVNREEFAGYGAD